MKFVIPKKKQDDRSRLPIVLLVPIAMYSYHWMYSSGTPVVVTKEEVGVPATTVESSVLSTPFPVSSTN
ncbi:hypothetical protein EB077_01830 [bacterium]|nr:hypothetical protein [bacterium]